MSEYDMQLSIMRAYGAYARAVVPNVCLIMDKHEADVVVLQKNGYILELEIKTSKADFVAEFKNKPEKHELLRGREEMFKTMDKRGQVEYRHAHLPNKYAFATPPGLLDPGDIPSYAGLLEFESRGFATVKRPPGLHNNKAGPELLSRLLSSFSRRYWENLAS